MSRAGDPRRAGMAWDDADTAVSRILKGIAGKSFDLAPDRLALHDGIRYVRVGAVTLDAELYRAYVLIPHAVAPGPVTVTHGDRLAAVRFCGPGWTAVLMPMRADEHLDETFRLDEVAGG